MSADVPTTGRIGWTDLTVEHADQLRDFYAAVAGWRPEPVDMGGYSDYSMLAEDGSPVAGICHARRSNEGLPVAWLVYITVADLDFSLEECLGRGGEVVHGPREMGADRYVVIRDPAGAVCALYQRAGGSTPE